MSTFDKKAYKAAWAKANREKVNAAKRAHYAKNREKELERCRAYQATEAGQAALKRARAKTVAAPDWKEKKKAYEKKYVEKRNAREQTPEYKEMRAAYRATEARKAAQKRYQQANKHKGAAWTAKRRAMQIQATPPWLTECDLWMIEQAYELAKLREQVVGGKWDVDHIVPVRGEEVRGLHVPWNLQVIPKTLNQRKGNRL